MWNYKIQIAGLCPPGSPGRLVVFLIVVETLSVIIRPLTLGVRLAANISAGHVVIALRGSFLLIAPISLSLFLAVYHLFEFGICIVQRYVFVLLVRLYSDEHPH